MSTKTKLAAILGIVVTGATLAIVGCDDSNSNAVKEPVVPTDSGTTPSDGAIQPPTDGGVLPDGAPSDCFLNPKTHFEIINACTDAVKITKNPSLALQLPDGSLPPLP